MAKSLILLSLGTCFRIVFSLQYQQQPYGLYDQQQQRPQYNPYTFRNFQDQSLSQQPVNVQQPLSDYQRQIQQWQIAVMGSQSGQALQPKPTPAGPPGSNIWVQIPGYYDSGKNEPQAIPPTPTIVAPLPPTLPPQEPQQPQVTPTSPPYPEAPISEIPNNELYPAPQPQPQPAQPENPLKKFCKAERGQFPSQSCSKFVNCWDDTIVEQDCPGGLYFNELGFCDYPLNVPCKDSGAGGGVGIGGVGGVGGSGVGGSGGSGGPVGGGGSEVVGGVSGPGGAEGGSGSEGSGGTGGFGELGTKCPESYGTYRSKKNCGVFYVCAGGIPYEFTCPAGLNFHEDLKVCDYPYRVECNGVPTNVAPPEPVTEQEVGTTGLPEPVSPDQGYPAAPVNPPLVENSVPSVQVPEQGSSGPPQTAYYSLKKIPAGLLDSSKPCAYNNVFKLNPSCSSVAVCQNGLTRIINCGPGTSYDSFTRQCAPSFRAIC